MVWLQTKWRNFVCFCEKLEPSFSDKSDYMKHFDKIFGAGCGAITPLQSALRIIVITQEKKNVIGLKAEDLYACSISDFGTQNKKRVRVADRDIFIVKAQGQFYALDSFCYHAGGPLYNGDIEDLGGRTCIKCPWHKYNVCLDTGQNYYQSVDPHNLEKPPQWTAGEVRQRTHIVTVRNGDIYVRLSSLDGSLDSDHYNDKKREK